MNSYSDNPNNEYKYQRLKEEFLPYGVRLDKADALSLLPFCYGDETVIEKLVGYDFVIYLDKELSCQSDIRKSEDVQLL